MRTTTVPSGCGARTDDLVVPRGSETQVEPPRNPTPCWADSQTQILTRRAETSPCGSSATTSLGLCDRHYREIVG